MSDGEMIGKTIAHYRIDRVLGEGGMGAVYQATDLNLQRLVALKVMHPQLSRQEQFQKRFLQEAQAAAKLDHHGIVRVLTFDHVDGQLILVMEYVSGGSIRDYIKQHRESSKPIDLIQAVDYARQIAEALHYAHQQGMTHRDIKPDNVLLKPDDDRFRALITDFGLAKLAESNVHSVSGVPMGTFAYMSPEQAEAERVDNRADIYALGIMLFEMTVGQLPFNPRSITEAIRMHSRVPLPRPSEQKPGFPPELEKIIIKATAKSPNDRYQTAGDLARDLSRFLQKQRDSKGAAASPEAPPTPAPPPAAAAPPAAPVAPAAAAPPAAAQPARPTDKLIVAGGSGPERTFDLVNATYDFGRDSDADIQLASGKVSRNHARLERLADGRYQITDLGSTNGTYFGETRIPANVPQPFDASSVVRMGEYYLRLQPVNAAPPPPPAAPKPPAELSFTLLENQAAPMPPGWNNPPAAPPPAPPYVPPPPPQAPPAYVPPAPTSAPQPTHPPAVQAYIPGIGGSQGLSMGTPTPPSVRGGNVFDGTGAVPIPPQGAQGTPPPPENTPPPSSRPDREQIKLRLFDTDIRVRAGERATLSFEVTNESTLVDHFVPQLLNLPEDWYEKPRTTMQLLPKQKDTAQITFAPPRKSSSKAGQHAFEVRAVSQTHSMQSSAQQARLTIDPYYSFLTTVEPQILRKRRGKVDVKIENKGNVACAYNIDARDREETLNCKVSRRQVTIEPGETEIVQVDVSAKRPIIVGNTKSTQFQITVDPTDENAKPAQTFNCEHVNKPYIPAWLLGMFGVSLIGLLFGAITLIRNAAEAARLDNLATMTATVRDVTETAQFQLTQTPLAATATAAADPDGDGLTTGQELSLSLSVEYIAAIEQCAGARAIVPDVGTDPNNPDTDGDGIPDLEELEVWFTVPWMADTDGDGLDDGVEAYDIGSDPTKCDTDGDGIPDGEDPDPVLPPTATPTPRPTLAVSGDTCGGSLPTRMTVGIVGQVTDGEEEGTGTFEPLRVREDRVTGDNNNVLDQLQVLERFQVLEGPQCGIDNELRWWRVRVFRGGVEGWVAEANLEDYFIEPAPAPGSD
jgi:tRNA A-37 threonylcarbamoyl transferase component Bud32